MSTRFIVATDDGPVEHFVLHFSKSLDVLDRERTSFVGKSDFPRKPVFQPEMVARYSFFAIPAQFGFIWFARDDLKKELLAARLTGLRFDAINP